MSFPEEGPLVVEPPEDAGSGLQVRKRGSLFTLSTKIRAQNKQTPTCLRPGEGWRNPRGVKMGWLMQEVDRLCEHLGWPGGRNCYCRWHGCPGERNTERSRALASHREGTLTLLAAWTNHWVDLLLTLFTSPVSLQVSPEV